MQKQVDTEKNKLLEISVINSVTKPASWVNPLVTVPKSGSSSVQICADTCATNVAVIRKSYQIPT